MLLYACPYSSPYKLDREPSVPVDEVILGKWTAMIMNINEDLQPIEMTLSKKNETEYEILFTGNLNDLKPYKMVTNDSLKGSAFISMVSNQPFLNIEIHGQTYITELNYKNDSLSLMPLTDGFTAKYILSDASLRTAVEVHLRTRVIPRFDEQFCLKNMVRVK
jgi:hypothetical protein